jgi:hypothetical protein
VSALFHAAQVPNNETVVVYGCEFCGGHHVGHSVIFRKIAKTESRIARARDELRFAASQSDIQSRNRQRIRDLEKHLAQLKKLLPSSTPEFASAA